MNIILYEKTNKKDPYRKLNEIYSQRIEKYCRLKKEKIKNDKSIEKSDRTYYINFRTKTDKNSISSTDFAKKIEDITVNGYSNIAFIIDDQREIFDEEISLTNLETSYDLSKVMLLEQIYRTFKINNNEVYHK